MNSPEWVALEAIHRLFPSQHSIAASNETAPRSDLTGQNALRRQAPNVGVPPNSLASGLSFQGPPFTSYSQRSTPRDTRKKASHSTLYDQGEQHVWAQESEH